MHSIFNTPWKIIRAIWYISSHFTDKSAKAKKGVSCSEVYKSRTCYTEWSKSEREKYCILTHIYGI